MHASIFKFFLLLTLELTLLQVSVSGWADNLPLTTQSNKLLALALKSTDYHQHTRHICEKNIPCYTNRLIHESSPYLLQHAHNPVDWYAWGEEALRKARDENKPIFLSIGYAACHWCHVMAMESFDNVRIANILNEHFIAIKVDRESRPDIDNFYANVVMYLKGQQGWPMTVFLTPDAMPFEGGGYYTPLELEAFLIDMSDYWKSHREQAIKKSTDIIEALQARKGQLQNAQKIDADTRRLAIRSILSIVDNYNGGFGESNKFPREPWLNLLLNDSYATHKTNASYTALSLTLTKMAQGGIFDQLGGGFHRYTTDSYWKLPHFEKMLYTQALLVPVYLQANAIKPEPLFVEVADKTVKFMLDEMRDKSGGFYSSLDSQTEGEEGKYYSWSLQEWNAIFKNEKNNLSAELYDIDKYGETDTGRNVLYLLSAISELAAEKNISVKELVNLKQTIDNTLIEIRNKRIKPEIDKKILMSWNGLVITSLSMAAVHLDNPQYLDAAVKAANFIWDNLQADNYFYRVNNAGVNSGTAQLEDYAFYLQALIKLYDVDKQPIWLDRARKIVDLMNRQFWDKASGAYYESSDNEKTLLPLRSKAAHDTVLPSANSVACHMLIRLWHRTGNEMYLDKATAILVAFTSELMETPSAFSGLLMAAQELDEGEKDLPVYAARGNARIDASMLQTGKNNYTVKLSIDLANQWHINSNTPLSKQLIATQLSLSDSPGWQVKRINYPQHKLLKPGFSRQPLALYEGHVLLDVKLVRSGAEFNPALSLDFQACNDSVCLAPEKLTVYPLLINKNQ